LRAGGCILDSLALLLVFRSFLLKRVLASASAFLGLAELVPLFVFIRDGWDRRLYVSLAACSALTQGELRYELHLA